MLRLVYFHHHLWSMHPYEETRWNHADPPYEPVRESIPSRSKGGASPIFSLGCFFREVKLCVEITWGKLTQAIKMKKVPHLSKSFGGIVVVAGQ